MNIVKKLALFFPLTFLMTLLSCVAGIGGVVREGGAAELTINTSIGPRTAALINSLRLFAGGGANAPILDGTAISRSLSLAPGVRSVSLRNTSPAAMNGNISIANIGDFLALPNSVTRFITFTESRQTSSILVHLDRVSAPQIIAVLSPEINDYLSALMAPVVLGETMKAKEYLDMVASIYSRPLANEIAEARIRGTLELPRPIKSIQGGTFSGNKAEFDIPLLDILLLELPLQYEVSW